MVRKEDVKLNIVNNGVFPITKDVYGFSIEGELDTGLKFPGTIQGEGKLIGTTCLFVRTSSCNLRCAWRKANGDGELCDTPFSSWNPDKNSWDIMELVKLVINNIGDLKYIVVTGGEPMIQPKPLAEFLKELKKHKLHITLETNGTLCDAEVVKYVDLISISPKLSNSTPWKENLRNTGETYYEPKAIRHEATRKNIKAIQKLVDSCYHKRTPLGFKTADYKNRRVDKDFQLKFVVAEDLDVVEITNEYLSNLSGVNSDDIVLMPLGSNRESLNQNTIFAMSEAVKQGWRYTPRLHVDMFNDKRSV